MHQMNVYESPIFFLSTPPLYRYTGDRSIMDGYVRNQPMSVGHGHFGLPLLFAGDGDRNCQRLLSSQDFDDDDLCLLKFPYAIDSASEVLALSCELSFDLRTKSLDQKIMDALSENNRRGP